MPDGGETTGATGGYDPCLPAHALAAASASDEMHILDLTIRSIAGQEVYIKIPRGSSLAKLKEEAMLALKCEANVTLTMVANGKTLEPDDSSLSNLDLDCDAVVTATASKFIRIMWHVYRSGVGAPHRRLGQLVASEQVLFDATKSVGEQWWKLSENAGKGKFKGGGKGGDGGGNASFVSGAATNTVELRSCMDEEEGKDPVRPLGFHDKAPVLWKDLVLQGSVNLNDSRFPEDVFVHDTTVVASVFAMRGCD